MKQLDLIAMPEVLSAKVAATCTHCGARGRYDWTRYKQFFKKLNPLGWSKIKGQWLCERCIERSMKGK